MNVAYIQFLLLRPIASDVCGDSIGKHERIKGYHSLLPFNHFKLLSFTPKDHHILANMLSNKRLKSNVVARLWVTKNITSQKNCLACCVFADVFQSSTQVLIAGFIGKVTITDLVHGIHCYCPTIPYIELKVIEKCLLSQQAFISVISLLMRHGVQS